MAAAEAAAVTVAETVAAPGAAVVPLSVSAVVLPLARCVPERQQPWHELVLQQWTVQLALLTWSWLRLQL